MGRAIGGAVVGYLVLFAVIFVAMSATWFALGADGAFQPGTWNVTTTWIAVAIAVAAIAGYLAGKTAVAVGRSALAGRIAAGIILVLGVVLSIPILTGKVPPGAMPRPGSLPMFEAMSHAIAPPWSAIVQPLLSAAGALFGARRRG